MRVVRTRRGIRLVQGRDVLSETLAEPGPTHGLFDVLAACIVAFAPEPTPERPQPRVVLLGFAAGGVIAPLRAMGFDHPIDAVDLSRGAEPLFRALCGDWAGEVRLAHAEASAWLRRQRRPFDVVLEDLTIPSPAGAIKPPVSVEVLPESIRDRLVTGGVAITNVLPVPGMTWETLFGRLARPFPHALVISLREYENRILVAGSDPARLRLASRRLRAGLGAIGSRQAERLTVSWLTHRVRGVRAPPGRAPAGERA